MLKNNFMSAAAALALTVATFGAPVLAADMMNSKGSAEMSTSVSADDSFVNKAAIGSAFEIQASQLALTHSQNDGVRTFARQMIDDHGQANDRLYSAASDAKLNWPLAKAETLPDATGNVTPIPMPGATMGTDTGTTGAIEDSPVSGSRDPGALGEGAYGGVASGGDVTPKSGDLNSPQGANATMHTVELDAKHQTMIDELSKAEGADFDKLYLKQQTKAHAETINLLQGYTADGQNAELKSFAQDTLPKVQEHQKMLKKIKLDS